MDGERPATKRQLKLIWVLARQLGMDSHALHELALEVTGRDSIKILSLGEGKTIIEALVCAGAKIKKKKTSPRDLADNVVEIVTADQMNYIGYLEKQLGWQANPDRLDGFLRRTIKKDRIRTKRDAVKIIEGLKAILNREISKKTKNQSHVN